MRRRGEEQREGSQERATQPRGRYRPEGADVFLGANRCQSASSPQPAGSLHGTTRSPLRPIVGTLLSCSSAFRSASSARVSVWSDETGLKEKAAPSQRCGSDEASWSQRTDTSQHQPCESQSYPARPSSVRSWGKDTPGSVGHWARDQEDGGCDQEQQVT